MVSPGTANAKTQRGYCKAKITRVQTFLNEHPLIQGTSVQQYETRLEMLEASFIDFNKFHNLVNEEENISLEYYIPVEEMYAEVKCKLKEYINEIRQREQQVDLSLTQSILRRSLASVPPVAHTSADIKLPTLVIPPFSGCYNEWPAFQDSFEAAVDKNESIGAGLKLQYLKSLLTGEALQLVTHFTITDVNYPIAWQLLVSRYNKKKNIVQDLISKFCQQPSMHSGSAAKLRELASTSNEIIQALDALDCKERDPWVIYLLTDKIDMETRSLWSYESAGSNVPTLQALIKFLDKRCDALEFSQCGKSTKVSSSSQYIKSHATQMNNSSHSKNSRPQSKEICTCCTTDHHYLFQCPRFKEWHLPARLEFVQNNQFCSNCLFRLHNDQNCRSSMTCKHCNERHHSLLHNFPSRSDIITI